MEIRNGGAMWTDYVNVYCEKLQGKWNKNMPHERCLYDSLYERFKRYGCSELGMFSDLVCREACQCDSKQDIILGKEW